MIRMGVAAAVVAAFAAGCGFTCNVQNQREAFANCDDLQKAFDNEKNRTDQPPNDAVLDDLDTCGSANGCNIKQ